MNTGKSCPRRESRSERKVDEPVQFQALHVAGVSMTESHGKQDSCWEVDTQQRDPESTKDMIA